MCANDFYNGQGRVDGPFCDYKIEDKMEFLTTLKELGVKNIEMEATCLAALTHMAGIKSVDVCVTFLDRLNGDQVTTPKATLLEWQERPMVIAFRYIKRYLQSIGRFPYGKCWKINNLLALLSTSFEPILLHQRLSQGFWNLNVWITFYILCCQ